MKARGKLGVLTEEDVTLWRAVAKSVTPRAGSLLPETPPSPVPAPATKPADDKPIRAAAMPPPAPEKPSRQRTPPLADLDRRTRARIRHGRIGIERAIDLHGLTQADAHAVLRRFLFAAHADDLRLVLVVTGKGERSRAGPEHGAGVLKRMVPHWLHDLDLRPVVLGFETAGVPHGGSGALYIRLRRRRDAR